MVRTRPSSSAPLDPGSHWSASTTATGSPRAAAPSSASQRLGGAELTADAVVGAEAALQVALDPREGLVVRVDGEEQGTGHGASRRR